MPDGAKIGALSKTDVPAGIAPGGLKIKGP